MDRTGCLLGHIIVVGDQDDGIALFMEIMEMFHQLHKQGNTIVLITHDNDVARQAKRVVHILDGKLTEVTL